MHQILGNSISQRHQISLQNNLVYTAGQKIVYCNLVNAQQEHFINCSSQINAVLLSRDGNRIYIGEQSFRNPSVKIYNIGEEKKNHTKLVGHKFGIKILLESPNQRYLISVGTDSDKCLFLWDLAEEKSIAVTKLNNPINQINYNDAGTRLVGVGQGMVRSWQFRNDGYPYLEGGNMIAENFILSQEFSKKNFIDCFVEEQIYTLTQDGLFCVFSLHTKQLIQYIQLESQTIFTTIFSGLHFYFGSTMQKIDIYDSNLNYVTFLQTEKGKNLQIPKEDESSQFDCIALEANQNHLVTVFRDKTIIIWDIRNVENIVQLKVLFSHQNSINDLILLKPQSTQETSFFVTSSQSELVFWHSKSNIENLKQFQNISNLSSIIELKLDQSYNQLKCLCLSNNGQFLAVGDTYGCLRIISLASFKVTYQTWSHTLRITCLTYWDHLESFVSGSDDKSIIVYNKQNYKTQFLLQHHTEALTHLFTHANIIVSYSKDKKLIFYKFQQNNFIVFYTVQLSITTIDQINSNLFFYQEGKIIVMDIDTATIQVCFPLENCLKLQCQQINNSNFISVINIQQSQLFEYSESNFILHETIQLDNISIIQITSQNELIIFCKDNTILLWKLQHNLIKNVELNTEITNQNKQWLYDNFWHSTQVNQDESLDLITFDSDNDNQDDKKKEESTPRLELLAFNLGEQHAQEIKNQFSEMQQHIDQQIQIQVKKQLEPIKEEDHDLLFNSFYEEQKSMQEFHKKQNSKIQLKEKMRKNMTNQTIEKTQQKVELQTNENIVIPLQSQFQSSKQKQQHIPFPKLNPLQLENSVNNQIIKNLCQSIKSNRSNKDKKQQFQFELCNQNSIFLNQSYNFEEQDSIDYQIESTDQLYQSQQINLAKCHIKLMMISLNELIEDLSKINREPRQQILKEIDKDLNNLDQEISEIRQVDSESICDEQDNIKRMVNDCSKEMFECYIKNILNQMRNQ